MIRTFLSAAIAIMLVPTANIAADDAEKLFQDSVRPLFDRKCFQCHSSKAEELKGNLKLESVEDILKGGDQGPAVIAGDVKQSLLLRAIRYQEDDYQMPPSGRLADEEIALVEKWVKALGTQAQSD
jgi:mono/diheme cytochrome c family protein